MSYTYDVKLEILNNDMITNIEKTAEISAVLLSKNAFLDNKIELRLENISLAKRIYKFLRETTMLKTEVKYSVSKRLGEHNVYIIGIPKQKGYKNFIEQMNSYTIDAILEDEKILKGFIKGVFLSCGYIKDPKKEYALDFFMDNDETADKFYNILLKKNKKVFKTLKRNKPLVYLRNSEDIMDIMVLIGSIQSFFKYEEMTMIKDLKNKTIREMNWEVANETKTLNTGNNQIKMINYIEKTIGLNSLSGVLEEIAYIRLENPESSLQEIADIIGISKSGVRNRFRRIEDIYNNLIKEETEE
ncbi:DNA-binding protein WhiA [Fusobacterium hominis]|uniref:Probable cell division protein WhiA n=1 Tax=Fusobacterium hominis TaxID=2764326 RepID=A0A7G9GYA6_9FUSO|nr:DNA-binding protein WhiA [Fusobacterium hominis]QNM15788.1 DNA-binding protein WhiA [Fusobacterium hominis]